MSPPKRILPRQPLTICFRALFHKFFLPALSLLPGLTPAQDERWTGVGKTSISAPYTELLLVLFPDGEDQPPRLKRDDAQAWTLNALAASYSRSVPLMERHNELRQKADEKNNLAIGLSNQAIGQKCLGELKAAKANLLRSIELCREIEEELREAVGLKELGRLRTHQGKFEQAEKELNVALNIAKKLNHSQIQGLILSYLSLKAILKGDYIRALEAAQKAREYHVERDIIQAEWLLGVAYRGLGKLPEADTHLHEALARCRKINMVDHEADILSELARLRRDQAVVAPFMGPKGEADKGLINQATH